MIALSVGVALALVAVVIVGRRIVRALQARVTALEARTDADQQWQAEVRKAIAASKG